jgi:hypothetical protein
VRKRRAGLRLCWIHVGGRGFGPRQMQLWMIQQETSEREEVIVVRFPLTRHRDTERDSERKRGWARATGSKSIWEILFCLFLCECGGHVRARGGCGGAGRCCCRVWVWRRHPTSG